MANKKGETVLSEYQYTYGLDGNVFEKSDHAGNRTTYAYNAQGMLAREAVYADTALTSQSVYAYDNRGNRITKTDTAGESRLVTGYTYDANNRLTKRSVGEYNARVDTIYTYDANGNLYTSFGRSYTMNPYHKNSPLASVVSDSMGITQYTFNTVNQLVGVQKDGLTATYSYLPDGMRNEKTVNGATTGHLWDGNQTVLSNTKTNADRFCRIARQTGLQQIDFKSKRGKKHVMHTIKVSESTRKLLVSVTEKYRFYRLPVCDTKRRYFAV